MECKERELMKCHICNGSTLTFKNKPETITYHWCRSCAYIFKSPSCYQPIEDQKSRYDLHENDPHDEGYRAYFQRFLDFVLPHVGTDVSHALDFGCGRSTLLATMLQDRGIACDAYDPIYHPSDDYTKKRYDLIVSTEVFEHLHQPKLIFAELVSRLTPGGSLAIQTQFHPNDPEQFLSWYYHKDPTHIVFFTAKTFQVLAQMHGCEMVAQNGKNMVIFKKKGELLS